MRDRIHVGELRGSLRAISAVFYRYNDTNAGDSYEAFARRLPEGNLTLEQAKTALPSDSPVKEKVLETIYTKSFVDVLGGVEKRLRDSKRGIRGEYFELRRAINSRRAD